MRVKSPVFCIFVNSVPTLCEIEPYTNMKRACLMLLVAALAVAGCKKENVDGEGGGNGNGIGGSAMETELEIGICACETKAENW